MTKGGAKWDRYQAVELVYKSVPQAARPRNGGEFGADIEGAGP